jgi:hypothetical protein
MNAKKFIVAAVIGTVLTVAASTQTASAAPWRRPIYHGPVYGGYWHRPYVYGTVGVPGPVVYDYSTYGYATVPGPYYANGVYVGVPRVNVRVR